MVSIDLAWWQLLVVVLLAGVLFRLGRALDRLGASAWDRVVVWWRFWFCAPPGFRRVADPGGEGIGSRLVRVDRPGFSSPPVERVVRPRPSPSPPSPRAGR